MIKGIYQTAKSLDARIKNIDVIANNLANLNTVGFKREIPFSEVLSKSGEIDIKQATDFQQGDVIMTSNPLDFAISGNGFFTVQTDDGVVLTRNGKFKLSEDGLLVTENGDRVLGTNGEISISDSLFEENRVITVSRKGEIKVGEEPVDQLLISTVDDLQSVTKLNGTTFIPGEGNFSPVDENQYEIAQGYLEESNINPIIELESMIQTNTDYESAYKMMNYLDQSLEKANEIGKV